MKDGYWINYKKKEIYRIDEHQRWITRAGNAKMVGIDDKFYDKSLEMDRETLILSVLAKYPMMRVRGHGEYVTFEFNSEDIDLVSDIIFQFCEREEIGEGVIINIFNFKTNKRFNCRMDDLSRSVNSGMLKRKLK